MTIGAGSGNKAGTAEGGIGEQREAPGGLQKMATTSPLEASGCLALSRSFSMHLGRIVTCYSSRFFLILCAVAFSRFQ